MTAQKNQIKIAYQAVILNLPKSFLKSLLTSARSKNCQKVILKSSPSQVGLTPL